MLQDSQRSKVGANPLSGLINTGIQAGLPLLANLFNKPKTEKCLTKQLKGNDEIRACVDKIIPLFDELEARASQLTPEQLIAGAEKIAGYFDNDAYFKQNVSGNDAKKELQRGKTLAAERLAEFRSKYGQAPATILTTDPNTGQIVTQVVNGQTVTTTQGDLIQGIPNKYLLLGVAGFAVLSLLKK